MSEPTASTPSPSAIIDIAYAHMSAKLLRAAERHGLFAALADGPATADELAERLGVPARVARILADAMNSLRLLDRADGRYTNTAEAAAYLAGEASTVHDLGPLMAFMEDYSYPHWLQFEHTVRTGEPGELDLAGDRWEPFLAGVMNYNALHARLLPAHYDLSGHRRMADIGGLCEYFSVEALKTNPELTIDAIFEDDFIPALTSGVEKAGYADRVTIASAPTPEARAQSGHDLVLLAHVIHRFDADQNRAIIANARAAADDGATLLVFDFVLDDDEHQRTLDAWMAGEYLVIDGTVVYPEAQVRSWFEEAGWRYERTIALPGSPRLLVATAV